MKILLSGGGTAGHINPAIAIAQILSKAYPTAEIAFVGTPSGMEAELVQRAGYRMHEIEVEGLKRSLSPKNLKIISKALAATRDAAALLKRERPTLVIGTGGYVCFPILRAAQHLGIATALHESNASPGLSVRLLSKKADAILISFKSTERSLAKGARTVLTGNPVRAEFEGCDRSLARARLGLKGGDLLLLSFGGSLGAETINRSVGKAMPHLLQRHKNLYLIHATGKQNYHSFCNEFNDYFKADDKRARILPFIENMASTMTAADLLLCRSGAMTLTEAAYTKTPAILVPYPGATDDHQRKNAEALREIGAANVIPDADLTPETLLSEVDILLSDLNKLKGMTEAIGSFAVRDADSRILEALSRLLVSSHL